MAGAGFGEHLKREREMRGVSLEEIAGATRISTRFLDALEREEWDHLPGGVFNRGFVRTVARFLGLEEESLLAEYLLATGAKSAPPPAPGHLPTRSLTAKRNVPWLTLAAIPLVLALVTGGWWGWQWAQARQAELNAVAASAPAAPMPPSAPSSLWAPEEPTQAAPVLTESPSGATSPWANLPSDLSLIINVTRDTTVTVTSDGEPTFAGTMTAGENHRISARSTLTIEAQDAGALRLELNGHALGPLGPSGQPGRITLGNPSPPAPSE